jgi:hypothetical protein
VGLVPENELSRAAGVNLNPVTNGPLVDSGLMTNIPGVFACGNVLQVHDLADWVVEEARRAAESAHRFLEGSHPQKQVPIVAGANLRYVNPQSLDLEGDTHISMRSLVVKSDARLEIRAGNRVIKRKLESHVHPSQMINLTIRAVDLEGLTTEEKSGKLEALLV